MSAITINLISGRTIQQGISMEGGKEKDKYRLACGIIEIDETDFKRLGIMKNTNVKVTSEFGSVIVKAIPATQGPHPGALLLYPWGHGQIKSQVQRPTQLECRLSKVSR